MSLVVHERAPFLTLRDRNPPIFRSVAILVGQTWQPFFGFLRAMLMVMFLLAETPLVFDSPELSTVVNTTPRKLGSVI